MYFVLEVLHNNTWLYLVLRFKKFTVISIYLSDCFDEFKILGKRLV